MKRVLITNDDGIHAEGLKALEAGLAGVGEVFVVAPEREMSATGQAISIHLPLRVRALDERHYAVSGTPADAVILALHQLLTSKPHLVVSGINQGGNLGENVIYSGTVAGALEATLHGVPAIAILRDCCISRTAGLVLRSAMENQGESVGPIKSMGNRLLDPSCSTDTSTTGRGQM